MRRVMPKPDVIGPNPVGPPFERVWPALVYALCTLAFVYPALTGLFLVSPHSDQFTGTAYRFFGAWALSATGDFPQWNPYILGGIPFIAAQHGDIFYPTFLLRLFLPADVVLTWSFALHLFLSGLFTNAFLRSWGLGFYPALLGGIAYMMSGQVASLVSPGHDGKMYVSALAPLLLWMIVRAVRDGRSWAWGMIALVTGLAIMTPHYQMVYYLAMLATAFTVWVGFRGGEGALDRQVAARRVLLAGIAALVGLAIAAVQFYPFYTYLDFAARGEGRGWEYATSYSMPPEEMLNFYLPQFAPGTLEAYWGRNPIKLHNEYVGAVVLMLAGLAFGARRWRPLVLFWGIAALVATLVALGGHTPFYRLWYLLPMMKVVRAPAMVFYVAQLAIAVFAAIGLERLLTEGVRRSYLLAWGAFAVAVVILAGGGALTSIAQSVAPPNRYAVAEQNAPAVIGGAIRSLLVVAVAAGIMWVAAKRRVSMEAAAAILVGLAALDLWSVERKYFRFSPPASQLYRTDESVEYLQRLPEPGRVLVLRLGQGGNPDPVLDGDGLVAHRVRAVTGHQGNELRRWVELAGAKSPAPGPNFFKREFRRLANVRYWLTDIELPNELPQLPGMRFIRRLGPTRNASGNDVWIYELDESNPAAWVAPVIAEADPPAILATALNPDFDVRRAALFDPSDAIDGVRINIVPEPLPIRAAVSYPVPHRIVVEMSAPAPAGSALLVSENWYPGWSALADGKPVTVGLADYAFLGIPLPAGSRRVELTFQDRAYVRGRVITLVSLAATIAAVAIGVMLERRRRV